VAYCSVALTFARFRFASSRRRIADDHRNRRRCFAVRETSNTYSVASLGGRWPVAFVEVLIDVATLRRISFLPAH
jgi:hypothetical protein